MKKESIKKFLNNGWTIGIGIPIILSIFGFITFDVVKKFLVVIGSFIAHVFTTEVSLPIWGFVLLIIALPLLFIVNGLFVSLFRKVPQEEDLVPFLKYKKDLFGDIEYRWEYRKTYDDKYAIKDITRHCPKCCCQIRLAGYGNYAEDCLNCGFRSSKVKVYTDDEVNMLIVQRIEQRGFFNGKS